MLAASHSQTQFAKCEPLRISLSLCLSDGCRTDLASTSVVRDCEHRTARIRVVVILAGVAMAGTRHRLHVPLVAQSDRAVV
eukprot:5578154-Pyramimonas_sp.AAC.1